MVNENNANIEIAIHGLEDGLALVKEGAKAKFDETIDMVLKIGVDTRKHSVRGSVPIASGSSWKEVNVIAFTDDQSEVESLSKLGVMAAGCDDLIADIKADKVDLSKVTACVASPKMMKKLGPVSRMLGPKGLMPNPKTGTVGDDLAAMIKTLKQGTINIRADRYGLVHASIGKASFSVDDLKANFLAIVTEVKRLKPAAAKGQYLQTCHFSSTMGAGFQIKLPQNI